MELCQNMYKHVLLTYTYFFLLPDQIKFVPTPGLETTDTSVSVTESVGTARVTIQRYGYGSSLPSGQTTVRKYNVYILDHTGV